MERNRKLKKLKIILMFMASLICLGAIASDYIALSFTNTQFNGAPDSKAVYWDTENYGVAMERVSQKDIPRFPELLKKTKLLIFTTGSSSQSRSLFENVETRAALKKFLTDGGTILFMFKGAPIPGLNDKAEAFFKEADVQLDFLKNAKDEGIYRLEVNEKADDPLLSTPNDLRKSWKSQNGKGGSEYFAGLSEKQKILMFQEGYPERAATIIQRGIFGNGKMIFTRDRLIGNQDVMSRNPFQKAFIENLLTSAFGKLGEGSTTAFPAEKEQVTCLPENKTVTWLPVDSLNPLYAKEAHEKPWMYGDSSLRVPVLAFNALSEKRPALTMSVQAAFPENVLPESIRVASSEWEELPSQARRIQTGKNLLEVTFQASFKALENRLFFIYGGPSATAVKKPDTELRLLEDDYSFTLINSRTKARLLKRAPYVITLKPTGASDGNVFMDMFGTSEGQGARFDDEDKLGKVSVKILENGPVRILIEYACVYDNKQLTVLYSLSADDNALHYSYQSDKPLSLQRFSAWRPGIGRNDASSDYLYLPMEQGLKRFVITGDKSLATLPGKEFGEGWYAFENKATGTFAGEIFDTAQIKSFSARIMGYEGYRPLIDINVSGTPGKGAYVASPLDSSLVAFRRQYLFFKSPPEIMTGALQEQKDVPKEWTRPVPGKNLIRQYHDFYSSKGSSPVEYMFPNDPDRYWNDAVSSLRRKGANGIVMWARRPLWPSPFGDGANTKVMPAAIKAARAGGMVVQTATGTLRSKGYYQKNLPEGLISEKRLDILKYKDVLTEEARNVGKTGVDFYLAQDEEVYVVETDFARNAFRKKYGMEPAEPIDQKKLSEPKQHNTALFQMDAYTEIIRDMTGAFRENSKTGYVGDQVNISAMTRIASGAPHDLDTHRNFTNFMSMDLYGMPTNLYKYYIKLMRATMGNGQNPCQVIGGCITPLKYVVANMNYMLMWGIDIISYFPPRSWLDIEKYNEVERDYHWLDKTGLGDMLASYEPEKRIALFRDRDAMIDGLNRGLWSTPGSDYDTRIQNIVFIKNLQTDIVMSNGFDYETIKSYPLLVVTSDPVISDKNAETIKRYVENGGKAYVEGETVRNSIVRGMIGVSLTGDAKTENSSVLKNTPFTFVGGKVPVKNESANVIGTLSDGSAFLFEKNIGKGKVFYCTLSLSEKAGSQDDIANYFRATFERLGGAQTYAFDNESMELVESNLLSDKDGNYILSIYNNTLLDRKIQLTWKGVEVPKTFLDFSDGAAKEFPGKMSLNVPKNTVKFYYLGNIKTFAMPALTRYPAENSIGYTAKPQSQIMDFQGIENSGTEKGVSGVERKKEEGLSYVAILSDKGKEGEKMSRILGDLGMYQALQDRGKLKIELIDNLESGNLSFYDALILPNIGPTTRPKIIKEGWEMVVRNYVLKGGALLACHHAVGFQPCEAAYLPEIAAPAGPQTTKIQDIEIIANHPVTNAQSILSRFPAEAKNPAFEAQLESTSFKVGGTFKTGFPDYVALKPGQDGQVIARGMRQGGAGGEPVIVVGRAGKGKVVMCGLALGNKDDKDTETCVQPDQNILVNAVYWLTEKDVQK